MKTYYIKELKQPNDGQLIRCFYAVMCKETALTPNYEFELFNKRELAELRCVELELTDV